MAIDETKTFSLRTVLTVTTGRLLTESKGPNDNGIGDLYEILGWMMMEQPFTHQLPRFGKECEPHLLRLFPELGDVSTSLDSLDRWIAASACPEDGIKAWLVELQAAHPEIKSEYAVPQFPIDHVSKDPIQELQEMAPHIKIIGVSV